MTWEVLAAFGLGYVVAAFVIGRFIQSKAEDALLAAMLQAVIVFTNQKTNETFEVTTELEE